MQQTDITCGQLMLRPWTPYDEDAVLAACQDADIQRWTTVPSPYTRADAHAWVNTVSPGAWERGVGAPFGIFDATTAVLLGSVGLHGIADGRAEIGYWCTPEARGRGVLTEAAQAVCRWGFGALELEVIEWWAEVGNWASRAVAEKCGFRFEGTRRLGLAHGGVRADGWVGSLLPSDPVVDRRPLPAPPELTDGVVTLRAWRPSDAADCARACDDPLTARWLTTPMPYGLADGEAYVGIWAPTSWADGTAAGLAITDAESGELLGSMTLKLPLRARGIGEVGYWTAPWARGRGAAGRGAALAARWGLSVLGLHRVELFADVDNLPSQVVAEKAGFTREGVARRAFPNRDGVPRDMVVFSLV